MEGEEQATTRAPQTISKAHDLFHSVPLLPPPLTRHGSSLFFHAPRPLSICTPRAPGFGSGVASFSACAPTFPFLTPGSCELHPPGANEGTPWSRSCSARGGLMTTLLLYCPFSFPTARSPGRPCVSVGKMCGCCVRNGKAACAPCAEIVTSTTRPPFAWRGS